MSAGRGKYGFLGQLNFDDVYNWFLGLEERQQILTVVGAIVVLIIMVITPITCATSSLSQLEDEYDKGKKRQESVMEKVSEYQNSKAQLNALKRNIKKSGGGSISTVIESLAKETGIDSNVSRLKPVNLGTSEYFDEEGVDGVVNNVNIQDALAFLNKIETYDRIPLQFKKLQIKPRYANRNQITLSFRISTIKIKGDDE